MGELGHQFEILKSEFDSWIVSTDADNEIGYSTAELRASPAGYAVFSGNLDLTPVDVSLASRVGVVNMACMRPRKAFYRKYIHFNWSGYTHMVFRVRGDGRTYRLNIHKGGMYDVSW